MDQQLDANLPLKMQRKPIVQRNIGGRLQNTILSLKNQKSNGSKETQDEEYKYVVVFKRIRNLNSMRFYVTYDGYTFPTASDESYAPIQMYNLSNKVYKLIMNKITGDLTYCLSPQYDYGSTLNWKFITEYLKSLGSKDHYELALAFEKFTAYRDEFVKAQKSSPQLVEFFSSLVNENLSQMIPQIAEIRVQMPGIDGYFVTRCVINKPMQKLLGIDANNTTTELHTGIKFPPCLSQSDSIKILKKYYDFHTHRFSSNFEKGTEEDEIIQVKRYDGQGIPLEMQVTGKLILYEGLPATVYSYHIRSQEGTCTPKVEEGRGKGMYSCQMNKDELLALQKTKQAAVEFGRRFQYIHKNLQEEPSQDRICRIKDLNGQKISIKKD